MSRIAPRIGWQRLHKIAISLGLPLCILLMLFIVIQDHLVSSNTPPVMETAKIVAIGGIGFWMFGMAIVTATLLGYSMLMGIVGIARYSHALELSGAGVKSTVQSLRQLMLELAPAVAWALFWCGLVSLPHIMQVT